MRFRRIRKLKRWHNLRMMAVVSSCFFVGVLFGWTRQSGSNSTQTRADDDTQVFGRLDDPYSDDKLEIPGRRQLSIQTIKVVRPFSRLPPNFEKNVFPPRTPAKTFLLEPHTVIERNRANDKGRSRYFMLFIVKSAPVHTTRREVIRKTWGAVKVVDGLQLNTIFVVGSVGNNKPLQDLLEKENGINGDILQTDNNEGYRNLPSKVLSAMQWLISKSSDISSDFYTFTDDDCVMNIANIADFFGELPFVDEENEPPASKNESRAISNVKEIQSIEIYEKKTVNEVTLPHGNVAQSQEKMDEANRMRKLSPKNGEIAKASESDSELAENLEIYAEMDPNAKIQIERTGRNDEYQNLERNMYHADIPEILNFEAAVSNIRIESYNSAYRQNAVNLSNYLKTALGRSDNPGAIFRSRTLKPDTIYCGFSYDHAGKPHRRMRDKWGVTMEQYSEDTYPTFCHGGMYTMSGAKMTSIFAISTVTEWTPYHLEDVLITGILREKTGVCDSKLVRRATDPKLKPLMYYVWDSGPRVMLKMSRKWKFFTRQLLSKKFVMEAIRDGSVISWNNYGRSA